MKGVLKRVLGNGVVWRKLRNLKIALVKLQNGNWSNGSVEKMSIAPPGLNSGEKVWMGRTVIVEITGGLCNQMMCYKAGRLVAEWNGASLVLYVPHYELENHQAFYLHRYPIVYSMLTYSKQLIATILNSNDVLHVKREDLFTSDGSMVSGDSKREVFSKIKKAKILYIDFWLGLYMWRSDQLFKPSIQVLEELTLDANKYLSDLDREVIRDIKDCVNPVAIHIRRSDFLTEDYDLEVKSDYYNRAMEFISHKVELPEYFVFSDDIAWCKNNLDSKYAIHFVDHNGAGTCTNDLFLGSLCRHFILTNHSTFSHHMAELATRHPVGYVITNSKNHLITNRTIGDYYTPKRCHVV